MRGVRSQERSGGVEGGGAAAEEPVRGEIAVCAAICGWARFIYAWHGVAKEAMPLREQLSLSEGKLAEKGLESWLKSWLKRRYRLKSQIHEIERILI